jgi:hypothetical protein
VYLKPLNWKPFSMKELVIGRKMQRIVISIDLKIMLTFTQKIWVELYKLHARCILACNILQAWKCVENYKFVWQLLEKIILCISILSMTCNKLVQNTPGAKILTFWLSRESLLDRCKFGLTSTKARDRRKMFFIKTCNGNSPISESRLR